MKSGRCPECGRGWPVDSMQHDCWLEGHIDDHHRRCYRCATEEE